MFLPFGISLAYLCNYCLHDYLLGIGSLNLTPYLVKLFFVIRTYIKIYLCHNIFIETLKYFLKNLCCLLHSQLELHWNVDRVGSVFTFSVLLYLYYYLFSVCNIFIPFLQWQEVYHVSCEIIS